MNDAQQNRPPCLLHEDEDILVVDKPAGWNTHAPSPHAGEGTYDWLRHREPRWAQLAIVHRLDRDTSGVMVFAKTAQAARSLVAQFRARQVHKRYLLLTDALPPPGELRVATGIAREGNRFVPRPTGPGIAEAVTIFRTLGGQGPHRLLAAEPLTGRTHQIRVHAASRGFPVLGDTLYGGAAAVRLCLHAARIGLRHPRNSEWLEFSSPMPDFAARPGDALRKAIIDPASTDAYRLVHGAADGWPGWYLDRLGPWLLSQSATDPGKEQQRMLASMPASGAYHKHLSRKVGRLKAEEACPVHLSGEIAPDRFVVRENGLRFELGFGEGYSVGLFLDQRDNRRRLLVNHVAAGFPLFPQGAAGRRVLNSFAYTCGFSVCAAASGASVTSLDLSRRFLDWGRRNFELNGLDPRAHDFIYGDAFDWLRRLQRKSRMFDAILLDPPTFSRTKDGSTFSATRDFGRLVHCALPLLAPGGVLFTSTNAAQLRPAAFLDAVHAAVKGAGRRIEREHYAPQPPDFPITRAEPGYLKTAWLRVL